jgi:hypothetical protein
VRAGDEAEIAFDAVPGRVFKGKVQIYLGRHRHRPDPNRDTLLDLGRKGSGGRAITVIDILDDIARPSDPLGVQRRRWQSLQIISPA